MSPFKALKRLRLESRVSDMYPITHLNSPSVFETKSALVGSVLRIEGVPFVTEDESTLNQLSDQLHQALKALDERFIIYVTVHRRRAPLQLSGDFSSDFAARVNEKYHARFKQHHLYRNEIFLTLIYKGDTSGNVARGVGWFSRLKDVRSNDSRAMNRQESMALLHGSMQQLKSQLSRFGAHLLGDNDATLGFSELMQFLSIAPNGGESLPFVRPLYCAPIARSIPDAWKEEALYPDGCLGQYICAKRILFGDCIQFQGAAISDTRFGAILSIKKYGKASSSMTLDALLQLDCEFISTHTFAPEPRDVALHAIELKRAKLESAEDLGISQIDDLSDLEDDIASESVRLGFHHNSVMLLAQSKKALEEGILDATKRYGQVDMILVREVSSLGLEPAFWAQIPGNHHFIGRASLITSENFVDFCSLHNEPTGFCDSNHLGSAVSILESASKTPVYFNYHTKGSKTNPANGHTAIYGATNAGKNTLVSFMDSQMNRYKGRSFFIDRLESSKIYVLASGNSAYTVISPSHQNTAKFNPFQLKDSPENRTFLSEWLAELVRLPNEVDMPSALTSTLYDCVNYAYDSLERSYRQLTHVVKCLPRNFPRWPELNRWLKGQDGLADGQFAWIFDNEHDALSFDFDKAGFDITWLMESVSNLISTPVYMVLLHRMCQSMDGKRLTSFILDEAWQVLNSPFWQKVLNDWLPSIRKNNGHFIFMTQSPATVVQSSIKSIITDNLATTVSFPNASATKEVYIEGLGFTEAEFETIKTTSIESRLFLYRQIDSPSMLCRLDLTGLSDEIRVFSANQKTAALVDEILTNSTTSKVPWLQDFLERSA